MRHEISGFEVVELRKTGVLYQMGRPSDPASALRELADDAKRRARLVDGGVQTSAEYHPALVSAVEQKRYRDVVRGVGRP